VSDAATGNCHAHGPSGWADVGGPPLNDQTPQLFGRSGGLGRFIVQWVCVAHRLGPCACCGDSRGARVCRAGPPPGCRFAGGGSFPVVLFAALNPPPRSGALVIRVCGGGMSTVSDFRRGSAYRGRSRVRHEGSNSTSLVGLRVVCSTRKDVRSLLGPRHVLGRGLTVYRSDNTVVATVRCRPFGPSVRLGQGVRRPRRPTSRVVVS